MAASREGRLAATPFLILNSGDNILDESDSRKENDSSKGDDTPYDAWEHICADAFDYPKRGLIALLTVYFDATYNQPSKSRPNQPILHGVGCYLARYEDWKRFRREWRIELGKKGLPYFHMTDFERAKALVKAGKPLEESSHYYGWSVDEFEAFQKRLYRHINRQRPDGTYRVVAFNSSLIKTDFDKTRPAELKNDPECKSHYIFNVANLMKGIARWCNENSVRDPIHYIFSDGDKEGNNLYNWFKHCWQYETSRKYYHLSKGYSRLGPNVSYDTQFMEGEPALQAADIVAYEMNKIAIEIAERGHANILLAELRKTLPFLCKADHFGRTLREPELKAAFSDILSVRSREPVKTKKGRRK